MVYHEFTNTVGASGASIDLKDPNLTLITLVLLGPLSSRSPGLVSGRRFYPNEKVKEKRGGNAVHRTSPVIYSQPNTSQKPLFYTIDSICLVTYKE